MKKYLIAAAALLYLFLGPALASQGSGCMPTTGTVSGLSLVQAINSGIAALISTNSGATAPATDCTGGAVKGQFWLDTSTTPNTLRLYDGTDWLPVAEVDASGHVLIPPVGGGSTTLASGTTSDLCSVSGSYVSITGTTTIASFSNTCVTGTAKFLSFASTPEVTYNATSMILPGAASITAQAGDSALVVYIGGGNWKALAWTRADGTAVSASSVFTGAVFFNSRIAPAALASNTDNWAPAGISAANVVSFSCSSAINITGITASATDGKIILLDNIGATNSCTITSEDANSAAANRFSVTRPVPIRPLSQVAVRYDLTAARWKLLQEITTQPIAGGFKNLKQTNDPASGTTLNNNLIATADQITLENVSGSGIRISGYSCSADVTASGAGGLDTGSVAPNTQYYYWFIYNPTTAAASCMVSLRTAAFGGSSITLPAGYTFAARGHGNFTDGSSRWRRTLCYGRKCRYVVTAGSPTPSLPLIASAASGNPAVGPSWTAVSIATYVPSTAVMISGVLQNANGGAVAAAPNSGYGVVSSVTNPPPVSSNAGGTVRIAVPFTFMVESTSIYYASAVADASLLCTGWEDNL